MNKTFLAALTCLLALAGCGGSTEDTVPRSLCPSCGDRVGGQTSDFGGLTEWCNWQELELTAESQASYETDAITAQLEAGMELPLYWSAVGAYSFEPDPIQVDSESVIEATFTIGKLRRWTDAPSDEDLSPNYNCGEKVETDVTMVLSTRDGHLQAELHGTLLRRLHDRTEMPEPSWHIFLGADLQAVTGTIELPIDETRIHDGRLIAYMDVGEDGFDGTIEARVAYYPDEAAYEEDHDGDDVRAGKEQTLLYGWFPNDASAP